MAHGYSLRPNTKRSYQSTDETDGQVEGTSTGTTTSNSSTSKGQHKALTEGKSATVDPRPTTPDTPKAVHNSPAHSHSSIIVTPSAISATATATFFSRNRRTEEDHLRPGETWEEIEAGRKREEARRNAEVIRIRREQIVKGYDKDLVDLRARIMVLRNECEEEVDQLREEWEQAQAFERGEVLVVVEDPRLGPGHGRRGKKKNYTPTETTLPSQSSAPRAGPSHHHRSEDNFLPQPPPLRRTQQQQLHLSQRQRQQEDDHGPHPQPQLQPLQRQPTRLMAMPTLSSSHHGLHHTPTHAYDGDNDSEMDG